MFKLNSKEIIFETYANGEYCLKEKFMDCFDVFTLGEENIVEWSYRGNEDFLKLSLIKSHLDYLLSLVEEPLTKINLKVNYLPYSRMDRSGENNYPFVLKYVSDMIKSFGFDNIKIVECHSDVGLELLGAEQVLLNKDLLKVVKEDICFDDLTDFIVYPDKGAKQRYESELGIGLHCEKVRDFESGRIRSLEIVEQSVNVSSNSKAIIVDDLCSYGNTFILASNELKRLGFKEIYLLVCHSEDNIFKGNVLLDDNFNKVYTTNSILTSDNDWSNLKYKEKLKVFSI